MLYPSTERIWEISNDDSLRYRDGEVQLDPDEVIINESDIRGILMVDGGLMSRDIAVFLRFDRPGFEEDSPADGYFIGDVEPDGSGILVHSQLVEQSPRDYARGRIAETRQYLHKIEPTIFEEFSVQALGKYIHRLSS